MHKMNAVSLVFRRLPLQQRGCTRVCKRASGYEEVVATKKAKPNKTLSSPDRLRPSGGLSIKPATDHNGSNKKSLRKLSAPPALEGNTPQTNDKCKVLSSDRVLVTGPAGSGKSTFLLKKAKQTAENKGTVVILSTWSGSLAASRQIQHKLERLTSGQKTSTEFHHCVLYEQPVDEVVEKLLRHAQEGQLLVIADEAHNGPEFKELCDKLLERLPSIEIWASASKHRHIHQSLRQETLKHTFRQQRSEPDRQLYHLHEESGHTGREPKDCPQCGTNVAEVLKEFGVGNLQGTDGLLFRDVMVLMRGDTNPRDRLLDAEGKEICPAMGVVEGLRKAGMQTRVVGWDDQDGIAAIASTTPPNEVVVTGEHLVRGLERKVVVWLGKGEGDYYDTYDKVYATSRSTDKVVWVVAQYDVSDDDGDDDDDDEDEEDDEQGSDSDAEEDDEHKNR